jgi:hypothetical protein
VTRNADNCTARDLLFSFQVNPGRQHRVSASEHVLQTAGVFAGRVSTGRARDRAAPRTPAARASPIVQDDGGAVTSAALSNGLESQFFPGCSHEFVQFEWHEGHLFEP